MLIVVADHIGLDVRSVGDGVDDVAIQQLPSQPLGDGLRDAPPAAAELPIHCQYAVLHLTSRKTNNSVRYFAPPHYPLSPGAPKPQFPAPAARQRTCRTLDAYSRAVMHRARTYILEGEP
ncbi:MAG: hypothetical protein ABR991_10235 [Terracidiphilus sp.]